MNGTLHTISDHLPFAAISVNFGPQAISDDHFDPLNWGCGWCIVIVCDDFDSSKGGHLVLHEAKLIIELSRGDAIFIPSACMAHGNLPILPEENRRSVVLYTAGGLFRWKAQGGQTQDGLQVEDPEGYDEFMDPLSGKKRWEAGWSLYETYDQICIRLGLNK